MFDSAIIVRVILPRASKLRDASAKRATLVSSLSLSIEGRTIGLSRFDGGQEAEGGNETKKREYTTLDFSRHGIVP